MGSLPRLTKACVRCHHRKVKCDAPVVGLPCSRCAGAGLSDSCQQITRQPRRRKNTAKQTTPSLNVPSLGGNNISPVSHVPNGSLPGNVVPVAPVAHPLPDVEKNLDIRVRSGASPVREVQEYRSGLNYLSILADVVDREQRPDLIRILSDVKKERSGVCTPPNYRHQGVADVSELDDDSHQLLVKKGVFAFPPRECMDTLLRCFFEYVYPSSPVFDRVEFMQTYEAGQYSAFMMQAILSIAALYVPMDTLVACGFHERSAAQSSFAQKACLLYDFRCETSTLRMLQGSFILSSTVLPYPTDKDFRYWFLNSVRLAVKMGMHRNDGVYGSDPPLHRLSKRIWCAIFARDLLFAFHGHQNLRMLTNNTCDMAPLSVDEWEDEMIPLRYEPFLPTISRVQKIRFLENYKLSVIASKCLSELQRQKENCPEDWVCPFDDWRDSLPEALRRPQNRSSTDEIWYTILVATSYRFEATIFRLLRNWYSGKDPKRQTWAKSRLYGALFELDTLLGRVVAKGMLHKYPLLFKSYVPVVLALYIEVAIDNDEEDFKRSMARVRIREGMLLLRQLQDFPTFQPTLRAFEWLLMHKNLVDTMDLPDLQTLDPGAANPGPTSRLNMDLDAADILQEPEPWFQESLGFGFLDTTDLSGF